MQLPLSHWQKVRKYFDDDEKADIILSQTGEMTDRFGIVIDEKKLEPHLRAKVRFHFDHFQQVEKARAAC